ncbi:WD40/YVTN/BNR-like repeat-containing protein [Flavobacterium orientale]|uniref:Oxidoreductase n=1 Tax=Flavobacterium orientale TaxID=1756020 RepID=A0A917DF28_9FLAO|nr:oxidoreductase [Flavobacterium orientale]GGD34982.1 hypothetical protein GCM10011343_26050 [Flavobacterium orientale]
MSKIVILFVVVLSLFSCKEEKKKKEEYKRKPFTGVILDTLLQDTVSIRAITLDNDKVWYASDKGTFGYSFINNSKRKDGIIRMDSIPLHFRGIAQNFDNIFLISTEKPAAIYKISKKDMSNYQLVFEDLANDAFYNGIQFWNEKEGIAFGDPINNKLNVIVTRDGGATWNKIDPSKLPKLEKDEYAFAASNSSITVKGTHTWIATGGKKSRVLYSNDKGESWILQETPIVSGKSMTGIYSIDFYSDTIGLLVGGDYEDQNNNFKNKALTINGGRSWVSVSDSLAFGYSSCVQFVPESGGTMLVALAPNGIYATSDSGIEWIKISDEKELHVLKFIDKKSAIAAGKNKMFRIRFTTN